jgi:hypothetical protein
MVGIDGDIDDVKAQGSVADDPAHPDRPPMVLNTDPKDGVRQARFRCDLASWREAADLTQTEIVGR